MLACQSASAQENWPQWRGPLNTGAAPDASPPTKWSETENIKWKVKIPGQGTSTPIVWGDKIYIQTVIATGKKPDGAAKTDAAAVQATAKEPDAKRDTQVAQRSAATSDETKQGDAKRDDARGPNRAGRRGPGGGEARGPGGGGGRGPGGGGRGGRGLSEPPPEDLQQFALLCLDRATGKTVWQKVAREELPHEGHHRDHWYASHSPVTDGKLVIAYFGSRGIHCYDMAGNLKWQKDLGKMQTKNGFGEGSSPALHGNTVVVNWDHEGDDFIAAFDKTTGDELWREPRNEDTSWGTPLIVEHNGKAQVITAATGRIRSYDLATGKQFWESKGLSANSIPSPVSAGDMVYLMSGFRTYPLYAIRLGGNGDLSESDAVVWTLDGRTPYVPSPLLYENRLYFLSGNNAVLSCYNAKTGEPIIATQQRLEGVQGVYSSPVAADGRVYVVGRNGTTAVIKHAVEPADSFEVLATNVLDERIDASPAIAGNELFLRGTESLYSIAEK
jgi:outer membrane protein assembly factor BamB